VLREYEAGVYAGIWRVVSWNNYQSQAVEYRNAGK
jgi:hypothetical protein